jgi:hypothetical protein
MTPQQLYDMSPQEVSHDIECYFDHVKEIELSLDLRYRKSPRIETRFVKHFNFDERRFWRLATVWFDGKPVIVIQNAGREGDDWSKRFITDADAYKGMLVHLAELSAQLIAPPESLPADQEIENLDSFYGNSLGGYFEGHRYGAF